MSIKGTPGTFTHRIQRLFQTADPKPSFFKSIFSFVLVGMCLLVLAFQNPFHENEKNQTQENDGMLFMITDVQPKLQLQEVAHHLALQNVKLDYEYFIDDQNELGNLNGKIIMPDNSYFGFEIQGLQHIAISLDWTRRQPLHVSVKGKNGTNTKTEVGDNGSLMAKTPQYFSGPGGMSCILDDLTVGNLTHFSKPQLFLNDLNRRSPLFILDGKKVSAKELEELAIPAKEIYSIIKLMLKDAQKKYSGEEVEDGVYEITTRRMANYNNKDTGKNWDTKISADTISWGNSDHPKKEQNGKKEGPSIMVSNGITVQTPEEKGEGQKMIIHGGEVKITNENPLDENFEPPLYFMNGIPLSIPEGKRLPVEVEQLEEMDSIIVLTEKKATDIYGEEGKNGVWLIYARDTSLDASMAYRKFNEDEKALFEKSIQIHPNPVIDEAFISYEIKGNQHTRVQVFNQAGQLITTLQDGTQALEVDKYATIFELQTWKPKNIPPGIYFVKIQIGGETFTRKIVKVNQ